MNINYKYINNEIVLSSKARTLHYIKKYLCDINILDLVFFTNNEWIKDQNSCLDKIIKNIKSKPYIVRSSASNEDTKYFSNAGLNLSLQNVSEIKLIESIDKVFGSYNAIRKNDEVLIQPMLKNVLISGVVFSHDPQTFSPYKTINWHHGNNTSAVTSGKCNGRILYHSGKYSRLKDEIFKEIFKIIDKLSNFYGNIPIDCEFAVTKENLKKKIWILQVRPLILKNKSISTYKLAKNLNILKNKIKKIYKDDFDIFGEKTILGVMPDWNPAEIIGVRPKPLALSLYKELITDKIWAMGRSNYGYQDMSDYKLLKDFFGQPYIDTILSFNSLLPKTLSKKLGQKLINFYLSRLYENPTSHDKIEFDIILSSFAFDLPNRYVELKKSGFTDNEINELDKSLIHLTNEIIKDDHLVSKDLNYLKVLEKKFVSTYSSKIKKTEKIRLTLKDLKEYGTLPFVGLARVGFIAVNLLKSMAKVNLINEKEYNCFMSNCSTISKKLTQDKQKLNKERFLKKYGHLRPGTYDILSPRYDETPNDYFDWSKKAYPVNLNNKSFYINDTKHSKINKILEKNKIRSTSVQLFRFIKKGIELRELSKFIFTKYLSEILKLIEEFGRDNGLCKKEISYVPINTLTKLYSTSNYSKNFLVNIIKKEKNKYDLSKRLRLPPLITKPEDIFSFEWPNLFPNFITQKSIKGNVINFENKNNINGNIVFIPNADPGFDWIFSHNPSGLITAWGGANSHMAIRAAELQIPAVLGVGEVLYQKWLSTKRLYINCLTQKVEII